MPIALRCPLKDDSCRVGTRGLLTAGGAAYLIRPITETTQRVVIEAHIRGRTVNGAEYNKHVVYVFDTVGAEIWAYVGTSTPSTPRMSSQH